MSDNRVGSFCPEHGINCKIDDDGTCSACGASAVGTALDEIERLKARVEELKKSNLDKALLAVQSDHHITDEQIDAAWSRTNPKGLSAAAQFFADGAESTLNKLNIHRCEGVPLGVVDGCEGSSCPTCNGHEWVIGGSFKGEMPPMISISAPGYEPEGGDE